MAKSMLSLYEDPIRINGSTAHTHSLTPKYSMLTISKAPALVETPVCHDTLAEKQVTKILKFFIILLDPVLQPDNWQ
jgi:hypothetical protein